MFSRILDLTVCEESRRACCSGCQTSCLVYSPGTTEGCFRQIYCRVSPLSFIQHASWALTAFPTKCIYHFSPSATYFSMLSCSYTFGLPHLALKLLLSHVCWAVMKWWLLFFNPCLWCILPKIFFSVLFSLSFWGSVLWNFAGIFCGSSFMGPVCGKGLFCRVVNVTSNWTYLASHESSSLLPALFNRTWCWWCAI